MVISVNEIIGELSHASELVATPKLGTDGHSIGLTTVGHEMEGGVLSSMKMVLLQVEEFPQSSVAVHVRVIEYS
jgi:hypothetical protein